MNYVLNFVSDECCEALQNLCLQEDWTLLDYRKSTRFWALKRFLRNTFERLAFEDRPYGTDRYRNKLIRVDKAQRHAIMNTGIVDAGYEWIYALMDVQWDPDTPRFSIKGFFLENSRDDSETFNEAKEAFPVLKGGNRGQFLPRKAHFANAASTVFDADYGFRYREPGERYEHIIGDRLYRFPFDYLSHVVGNRDKWALLKQALERAAAADHKGSVHEAEELMATTVVPLIQEGGEHSIERKIQGHLDAEILRAVRRARYNRNVALPGYYPKRYAIQFYLPLCMASVNVTDLVLVVSVENRGTGNPTYTPRTVLGIDDTFADTRLVLPPQESWLPELARKMRREHDERYGGDMVTTPRLRSLSDSFVSAQLINSKDERDNFPVRPGYYVGVNRLEDYECEIGLDKKKYKFMHTRHGRFDCKNGQWLFYQFGGDGQDRGNGTTVCPADGSGARKLLKGDIYELHSGDELRFGDQMPGWVFVIPED